MFSKTLPKNACSGCAYGLSEIGESGPSAITSRWVPEGEGHRILSLLMNRDCINRCQSARPRGSARDIREKRQVVTTPVRRVTIGRKRDLYVGIRLNLLNLFADDTPKGFEGKNKGQSTRVRIHPRWCDDS